MPLWSTGEDRIKRGDTVMEFEDLVKSRRSCRSFESSLIPDDQIDLILDAGRWAPSPLNLQPWEFIIITDPDIKAEVRGVAEEAKQEVLHKDGPKWVTGYGIDFLEEAPVLIVVLVDPSRAGLGSFFGQKHGAVQAASACIQNMILAAADQGLGALWFTFFRPERLKAVLGVPEQLEIAGVIPLGRPGDKKKAIPRRDIKIYNQRYILGA